MISAFILETVRHATRRGSFLLAFGVSSVVLAAALVLPIGVGYRPVLAIGLLVAPLLSVPLSAYFVSRDRERGYSQILASMGVPRTAGHIGRIAAALLVAIVSMALGLVPILLVTAGAGTEWREEIVRYIFWGTAVAFEGSLIGFLIGQMAGTRVPAAMTVSFAYCLFTILGVLYAPTLIASYAGHAPKLLIAVLHLGLLMAPFDALDLHQGLSYDVSIRALLTVAATILFLVSSSIGLGITQTHANWKSNRSPLQAILTLLVGGILLVIAISWLSPAYGLESPAPSSAIRGDDFTLRSDLDLRTAENFVMVGQWIPAELTLAVQGNFSALTSVVLRDIPDDRVMTRPTTLTPQFFEGSDSSYFANVQFELLVPMAPNADRSTRSILFSASVAGDEYALGLPLAITGPGPRHEATGIAGAASLSLFVAAAIYFERRLNR